MKTKCLFDCKKCLNWKDKYIINLYNINYDRTSDDKCMINCKNADEDSYIDIASLVNYIHCKHYETE